MNWFTIVTLDKFRVAFRALNVSDALQEFRAMYPDKIVEAVQTGRLSYNA